MGCGVPSQTIKNTTLPSKQAYQRKEVIAVGHHGKVYRSCYKMDKQQYAEKCIEQFRADLKISQVKKLASQMLQKLQKLHHQRIVAYLSHDIKDTQICVMMEVCQGGTLKSYMQTQGPLQENIIAAFIRQILEGLKYLHSAGVIHKDLKGSNVLISGPNIKLTDYSLAQIYDPRLSQNKNSIQRVNQQLQLFRSESLPFIAPQVIKNLQITAKSDVWSVGCIIIEMLTAKMPWSNLGKTWSEQFKVICESVHPPFPKDITEQCYSFLENCLAVIPSQRSSVDQLISHEFITRVQNNKVDDYFRQFAQEDLNIFPKNKEDKKRNASPQKLKRHRQYEARNKQADGDMDDIRKSLHLLDSKLKERYGSPLQKQDKKTIQKDRESQKGSNQIMLNNRPVKFSPKLNKSNQRRRIYTENNQKSLDIETKLTKVGIDQLYLSVQQSNKKHKTIEDSLDLQLKMDKSNYIQQYQNASTSTDKNKQYFKKPLIMLKKKLKERRQGEQIRSHVSNSMFVNHNNSVFINPTLLASPLDDDQEISRENTSLGHKQEEKVIDTTLARVERDRYWRQQTRLKQLRSMQQEKWEQQLKEGAKLMNLAFGNAFKPVSH